jgi:hypothetical protein
MTFKVDGANGLTFSDSTAQATSAIVGGKLPYTNLPAGSVLQVVQTTLSQNQSTTSSSFQTTTLSVSITPKFTTSKILVFAFTSMNIASGGVIGLITLARNGTNLGDPTWGMNEINLQGYWIPITLNYLDSPNTTSAVTYAVQYRVYTAGNNVYIGGDNNKNTIIAMEIAA